MDASVPVMKDIQWTTFDNAKKLVKVGAAKSTDFWVFVSSFHILCTQLDESLAPDPIFDNEKGWLRRMGSWSTYGRAGQ